MQNTGGEILGALDAFIRKYYRYLAVRGSLLAVGIVAAVFLAAVLVEHFGWLAPVWRGVLFWGGLGVAVAVAGWLVVRPLLKMHGLGSRIGRDEAARIVGRHFPEVGDKLLNLLQLMEAGGEAPDAALLLAAVEQKTASLRAVPMLRAVDMGRSRRYLVYALPPLAVIGVLLLVSPGVVTEPSRRIARYGTEFERPAPFRFVVDDSALVARQGEDYTLLAATEGDAVPAEVWLCTDGRRYKMQRGERFAYTFAQVRSTTRFYMEGGGVRSREYTLAVLPNPAVMSFSMRLAYPAYTGRQAEVVADLGDAVVPEGTTVQWRFQTRDADSLLFTRDTSMPMLPLVVGADGRAEHSERVDGGMDYAFCALSAGGHGWRGDTLVYTISAVADAMPQISVDEAADSLNPDRRLFSGAVKDDYGFSRLRFRWEVTNPADSSRHAASEAEMALPEPADGHPATRHEFYFAFNLAEVPLGPGDELAYWFEVSDNDAIHGPKTVSSRRFAMRVPGGGELDSLLRRQREEVGGSAAAQMEELRQMQAEVDRLMQRLVDKKELDWQDRQDLRQLAEKQRQVRDMMQQMRRQIDENNRLEQRYREQSEQIAEKQRELDRLMNEVMDEKMRQTLKEMEQLVQQMDKKRVQQQLEKMKLDNADLERQLDQNIGLMKRLELEKRVEQTVQNLDKLAGEQRRLAEETVEADPSRRDEILMEKQREMESRFGELEKEIESIKHDYRDLDPQSGFNLDDRLQQQVGRDQEEAGQRLGEGDNSGASEMQRQAADDMEQLGEAMARAQLEAEQQELAEDAEQVRRMLKNLVRLSMNQEELVADLSAIYIQDPRYQTVVVRQNRVKDDFRAVDDSLRAMAGRQVQVASAITRNLGEVESGVARSLSALLDMNQSFYGNYHNTQAARSMQQSMTALNNLALVLAESLDKMQSQMRSNSSRMSSGQCKNPGRGKGRSSKGKGNSAANIRQMQQALDRQLEAMRRQMEQQGGSHGNSRHTLGGGQQMSEELARLAAQQEAVRRAMEQYARDAKASGGGDARLAREIDQILRQMEQNETDIVNRAITRQTVQRQHQIVTRLLEHERAEMEREQEQRRESREATSPYSQPTPDDVLHSGLRRKVADDGLRSLPPTLRPFYRDKVNDYFFAE